MVFGRGQVRSLAAASFSKFGSWSLGLSQDIKFSSLKLQVLLLKASRYPDKASDPAAVIFRPWWPFDTGWNVPVCLCRLPRKDSPSLMGRWTELGPGTVAKHLIHPAPWTWEKVNLSPYPGAMLEH